MARRIPPLNPLHTFEVVARTGNLTAAAAQLHVTQSAVSRQITALEEYFGVELFVRERQGVSLTEVGQRYAAQIVPAFAAIATATEQLWHKPDEEVVRVGVYSTFSAKWLIPRLPQFLARHPGKDVRIHRLVPAVNFERDPVDMAIQLAGDEVLRQPGLHADALFAECLDPVCSPVLLERLRSAGRPATELLGQRLLVSKYHAHDWDDWLQSNDLQNQAEQAERMVFNASMLTWQAAVHGLGVAMGQWHFLQDELQTGALVRPFERPLYTARSYWLLRPRGQRSGLLARALRSWLLQEAGKMEPPG
ncbi:LysR substrate-binding domain-containing protein [Comamonas composti]|uniref:LysR substrate-binding domain-containing protein n=1 Tax=Comamonas composti TaxID=408558 RepID=UPI000409424C|nr:LysR substrate-binding domain-containing protein [Comamonas composti]